MLIDLFLDDFLQGGIMSDCADQVAMRVLTDEWAPDCFKASISAVVRGCTTLSSFISSFVASVSSEINSSA